MNPSPVELAKDDPWLLARLADEGNPSNLILVPAELSKPCPVLAATIDAVAAEKKPRKSRRSTSSGAHEVLAPRSNKGHLLLPRTSLGLRVSLLSVDRALLLIDTLLKACLLRGLSVSIEERHLKVSYQEHWVEVRISERVTRVVGSTKGLSKSDVLMDRHITHHPTGEITIAVARLGSERKTTDKPGLRLEEQLGAVLNKIFRGISERRAWFTYLEKSTADSKAREEARKAEQAAREAAAAEAKRIEDYRRQRQLDLVAEAAAWQQSKTILAYTDHLAAVAIASGDPISADLQAWIESATETAKAIDPTNRRLG